MRGQMRGGLDLFGRGSIALAPAVPDPATATADAQLPRLVKANPGYFRRLLLPVDEAWPEGW